MRLPLGSQRARFAAWDALDLHHIPGLELSTNFRLATFDAVQAHLVSNEAGRCHWPQLHSRQVVIGIEWIVAQPLRFEFHTHGLGALNVVVAEVQIRPSVLVQA